VLPAYAGARNDASRPEGASTLSPYLHFGVVGPREIMAAISEADVPEASRSKFADELLSWREWFHYKARGLRVPESYARVPNWARKTLDAHASDPRPGVEALHALTHGETADETWNACQRQYVIDGWMHNNLRMYWAKRLIAMTPDPRTGWATACYLNDRLSLDGRDPSTYGNLAWAFGDAAPGYASGTHCPRRPQVKPGPQTEGSSRVQVLWHWYSPQTVPSGQGGSPSPQPRRHCIHTSPVRWGYSETMQSCPWGHGLSWQSWP